MAGRAYQQDAPLIHVRGHPGRIRAVPRRMFRQNPMLLAELHHHAIQEAVQMSPTGKVTFVVNASELRLYQLNVTLLASLHHYAVLNDLYKDIKSVVVENPTVLSKAFYAAAKALQSPMCNMVELREQVGAGSDYKSSDSSDEDVK